MSPRLLKIFLITVAVFVSSALLSSSAGAAEEASMSVSPTTGVHTVGSEFYVDIVIDTGERDINAGEAMLLYNPEELEVVGLSLEGSIFTSWVLEPYYDNGTGRIEFAGNTSSTYNGVEGKVMTLKFKTLEADITSLRFDYGGILSADGRGTNIVSKLISGVYTVNTEVQRVTPEPEYIPPRNAPGSITITSPSHPNQNTWYKDNLVELRWSLPSDIVAVRMVLDKDEYSIPSVYYGERVTERTLQNLEEGVWYFHLQGRNAYGWGEISHYKIKVDYSKPEYFRINELSRDDKTDPVVNFIIDSFDSISGIDKYEIVLGEKKEIWMESENQVHKIGPLDPGSYLMTIKAIDASGNYLVDTVSFEVEHLDPPILYEYPDVVNSGSALVVKGNTYANADVVVYMQRSDGVLKEHRTTSDSSGIFTFIPSPLPEDGIYDVWGVTEDSKGSKSKPSKKIRVAIRPPSMLMAAAYALDTVSLLVPLVAVLFFLSVLIAHFHHKYVAVRQALKKEVQEAEMVVHKSFLTLKKEADRNVKILEKAKGSRGLTREELAVMDGLRGNLQKIEDAVSKEIYDIEKTLGNTLDMRTKNKKIGFFGNLISYIKKKTQNRISA